MARLIVNLNLLPLCRNPSWTVIAEDLRIKGCWRSLRDPSYTRGYREEFLDVEQAPSRNRTRHVR